MERVLVQAALAEFVKIVGIAQIVDQSGLDRDLEGSGWRDSLAIPHVERQSVLCELME